MANCTDCGKKIGLLDSSNDYNGKLLCTKCYESIQKSESRIDKESEPQKGNAGSFEAIAILGKMIFVLGGLVAILIFITAVADGEAILIVPAIATLVSSLVFGALLVALGFIGLELNAIRNSLNSSLKSSSDTK